MISAEKSRMKPRQRREKMTWSPRGFCVRKSKELERKEPAKINILFLIWAFI